MLRNPPRSPEWLSWLWVVAWSALIFVSIPTARRLQAFVSERWGRESFATFTLTMVVLAAIGLIAYLVVTLRRLPWRQAAWLLAVTALYFYIASRLKAPEEALHFIEYGVLAAFCFRALSHRTSDASIYLQAILICTLIGTVDEIVQWATPQRFWEFRDVWLNVTSAALAQLAIWQGLRPAYIARRWEDTSVRRTCHLAIAAIVLLILCALNTPQRVGWYAIRVPSLSGLDGNPSVMAEYGYRHEDSEIGTFFSRLTLEELARQDRHRGAEIAARIDSYSGQDSYPQFLEDHPVSRDPFAYELRVHMFRRDRYLDRARSESDTNELDSALATVAWKEHRILEKYFPVALGATNRGPKAWRLNQLQQAADKDAPYVSEVSRHLITRIDETRLLLAALLLVGLLAALPGAVRRARTKAPGSAKS